MQGCQSWMQGPPIQGEESVPTLPSVPLCSLQLEEERDRADGYLRQSVMYLQSPQKSIREAATRLTGEPKPPGSLAALLQLGPGPSSGTQPSGCGTLTMPQDSLPPSPSLALALYTWLSPAKVRRTCGQACSTGVGELCHWGGDRLGVPSAQQLPLEQAEGIAPGHL